MAGLVVRYVEDVAVNKAYGYKPLDDETPMERVNSGIVVAIAMGMGSDKAIEAITTLGVQRHWQETEPEIKAETQRPWWRIWRGGR